MYPLIQVGSFSLSTGGLFLVCATYIASWLAGRIAQVQGDAILVKQVDAACLPVAVGALLGGRLWYGVFNWDLYGQRPALFFALRIADVAWPGALLGGILAGWLWARKHRYNSARLADIAALALPLPQALASIGLALSGEAFGNVTDLPWGVPLFGASRHPTQLYYMAAALLCYAVLRMLARYSLPAEGLFLFYLGLQGMAWLLIEAFRADSLIVPGGLRAAQILGLGLLLMAMLKGKQASSEHSSAIERRSA